ncbi:uncharacterized protein LOC121779117 [Salvia splendens]|uniref:uncharacterized protein LOC121779117 n=1 Tax=Salvia splendens TaxID=180675 RepID=UPI001C2675D6|nr:uncharacterized protein LOC121779117 [Salvia splendens]
MEKKMAELMDQKLSERDQVIHEQEIQILELRQAIATINLQNQKNNAAMDNGEGSSEGKSDWGRSTRYEFPKFDGEGFEGWMMRAEYFFQVARVPEAEKVKVAAIHMEGKALQWHRGFLTLHGNEAYVDWRYYISCVAARFGAHAFEDPLADLRNLKQKGTLQSYMDTFDELYPRASIREDQALSFFLSGLIDELQMPVRMFKPKSLAEAYSLAKLQELTVKALGIKPKVMQSNVYSNSSYYSSSKPLAVTTNSKPVVNTNNWSGGNKEPNRLGGVRASTNLSPKEMDEKRARKECFWCTEKFTPNHQCSKRKFYVIQLIELGDTAESEEQADLADETRAGEEPDLQLSLHAVWGKNGPQLMRIRGICQKKALKILIDTGSTHNFLSSRVAKKIKCELTAVSSKAVEVANGQLLQCNQKCSSLEWEMQGATFQAEVYLIHLETYDLILGGAWLSTLGEITWDFNKLTMQFKLSGAVVKLQGELWSPKSDQLHCLHICNLQEKDENERKISQLMPSIEEEISFCYEISTEEIWPELKLILDENEAIFAEPSSLPPPREQDHKIILKEGSNAVNIRPYKYASKQKDIIETMIDEMLKSGVIRHSESSFASPIVLVKKKDSSWRMCVDYRALNAITVKDKYPIPVIEELLDELGGATWFSKIDLRSGYWQVRMRLEDIHKTAFKTHSGHYEFLVMPFGLTNAPATFQNLMNSVFREHLRKFILVFFDDILIYSKSKEDHEFHLKAVMNLMKQHSLLAKKSKCSFGCRRVEYLGHVISADGVATDEAKIAAVKNWPRPKTIKHVRSFLGLTGYYRRFVYNYGVIAKPLIEVTKGAAFSWPEEAQEAFDKLKSAMISAPVLALPDFSKEFVVETDASGVGIGAVLMQEKHPIAFISKALTPKHQALSVYEKELLAILMAVKKWYYYLQCRRFIILTDHQSLKYLVEQKLTTPTQQAWMTKLMQFDYEIRYKKGCDNAVADALSRVPESMIFALTSLIIPLELIEQIKESWKADQQIQLILNAKQTDTTSHPKFSWKNGELRRNGRLVVGNDVFLKAKILTIFHESATAGHSGVLGTYKRISALCYWPKMMKDVKEFVRMCKAPATTVYRVKGTSPLTIGAFIFVLMASHTNEEIYISYLCDQIMAACNRINKKLDVMDEQQRLFTYTVSYATLKYSAPAYVTPGQTTAEHYFHNQPTPSKDYHHQLPPPKTYQPPPSTSPTTYQQPPLTLATTATSLLHQNHQPRPSNAHQSPPPPNTHQPPRQTTAAPMAQCHNYPQPPLPYL